MAYSHSDVAKAFAKQQKHRMKGSNMWFEGNIGYSYRTAVVALYSEFLLVTARRYSMSTDRHVRYFDAAVWRRDSNMGLTKRPRFDVVDIHNPRYLQNYLLPLSRAETALKEALAPRKWQHTRERYINEARGQLAIYQQYVTLTGFEPDEAKTQYVRLEHVLGSDKNIIRIRSIIALTTGERA